MADYVIFKIGNTDYTPYLRTEEYSVLRQDVIENWVDANRITRGHVLRTRITGRVRLVFRASEFDSFLTVWSTAKNADGTYTFTVHVNNDTTSNENIEINAYATLSSSVVFGIKMYEYMPTAMVVEIEFEEA